ncbi:uncharacterized protein [Drosophila kikkawai]|uniref:Uncharacterized protein n=1 Tax=Drosophila kikkawai TaxID=30033 RepID=A0A6P4IQZ9_DROKI|nr:uncharacterized protein LOC108080599 [Drosophila kikkawai]XP_017030905.1 uncharacterized protein LOC108080599 [Drosophila kikkawai]XP_041631430.1 uncharacterized protein LOC108080599 [Drosophila kikkawai]
MEPNKFKKIDFSSELPQYLPDFFRQNGEFVEEIVMTPMFALGFRLVGQHCSNLQSITISDADLITENLTPFKTMIVALKNLKEVQIDIKHNDASAILKVLKELQNLKTLGLNIEDCTELPVDLAHLKECVYLETLTIKGTMVVLKINDISSDLKILRSLLISGGKIISNGQEIAYELPALEKLELFHIRIETSFPDCQKLRILHTRFARFNSDFCEWLSVKIKTLESVGSNNSILGQDVLSEIFSSLPSGWVLPNLKNLMLYEDFETVTFPLPYCPMLTSLNLAQVDEFPKECMDWITKHSSTLESVELPGLFFGKNSSDLPFFPKLRAFRLNSSYELSPDSFFNWISKHSETLVVLNIYGNLDRNRLLKLLSDCRNIRSFRIARTSPAFTENFLRSLFNILKENGVTPDNPFKFKCNSINLSTQQIDNLHNLPNFELCTVQIEDNIGSIWEPYNEIS